MFAEFERMKRSVAIFKPGKNTSVSENRLIDDGELFKRLLRVLRISSV